ncbi:hypothetical protein UA08_08299 [Talaromyces atroroseus]|uniref:gamma-glutamylcyclotransferase n=1 Tax=Talaromyces atroroseus TaxID=1441469 RepID=A0A225ALQ0_TALAT|nr:hypothetical protein UA08_08299 [Talaromyces atroroseus]OKL56489.1 hypothetical protein UA08_08299 [Talaromyces atroroseus]
MPELPQWYFGYGSNMVSDVFTKRRQIQPLKSEVAVIESHTLCFDVMGVPYTDPAMGGIRLATAQDVPVYGVAYLLSPDDMRRVIITEGGGIAYKTAVLTATLQRDSTRISVITLIARHQIASSYERMPSERYMGLLIQGAKEKSLPEFYQKRLASQPTFKAVPNPRFRIGKWLFDSFWQRVAFYIQKGVHHFNDENGNVPGWFLNVFDG